MADEIQELLERNKSWAEKMEQEDPGFFCALNQATKTEVSMDRLF